MQPIKVSVDWSLMVDHPLTPEFLNSLGLSEAEEWYGHILDLEKKAYETRRQSRKDATEEPAATAAYNAVVAAYTAAGKHMELADFNDNYGDEFYGIGV